MKTTMTKRIFWLMLIVARMLSASNSLAQNCSGNKVWACRYDACGVQECKCINASSVQSWTSTVPQCNDNNWFHCHHCFFRLGEGQSGLDIKASLYVYPNPVSSSTTISFSLDQTQHVSLSVFDLNGKLVSSIADASFEEGDYEIIWNAADVNAGIYFLHFQSEENSQMLKLSVTK
jgi:hypothetical protein